MNCLARQLSKTSLGKCTHWYDLGARDLPELTPLYLLSSDVPEGVSDLSE